MKNRIFYSGRLLEDAKLFNSICALAETNLRRFVIKKMLIDPDSIETIITNYCTSDFAFPENYIFDTILKLHNNGEKVDIVSVADRLEKLGLLKSVGGRFCINHFVCLPIDEITLYLLIKEANDDCALLWQRVLAEKAEYEALQRIEK